MTCDAAAAELGDAFLVADDVRLQGSSRFLVSDQLVGSSDQEGKRMAAKQAVLLIHGIGEQRPHSVAIIDGNDRDVYGQQQAVHG